MRYRKLNEGRYADGVETIQTLREIVKQTESTGIGITVTTEILKKTRLRTDKETLTMAVESALEHAASEVTVAAFFAGVAVWIGALGTGSCPCRS
jgi:hypothetical protein